MKIIDHIKCLLGFHAYKIIHKNEVREVKICTRCHKEISSMYDMLIGETYWVNGNIWKELK